MSLARHSSPMRSTQACLWSLMSSRIGRRVVEQDLEAVGAGFLQPAHRPEVEQVGQAARACRRRSRSSRRPAAGPEPFARRLLAGRPHSGSSRMALACWVSTSVTRILNSSISLVADLAALFLGERLLERAALIHRRRGNHAALVGNGLHARELAWCHFHDRLFPASDNLDERTDPGTGRSGHFNTGNSKSSTSAAATASRRSRRSAAPPRRARRRTRCAFVAGMPRREQRAAVLVGDDRDRIGAEPLRFGGDLFLVHADERPQHRHASRRC